jgi:uncharacterized protein YvpB
MIILEGCKSQPDSLNHKIILHQIASTTESIDSSIKQNQMSLLGKIVVTMITPDPTSIPTEVSTANSLISPTETSSVLPPRDTNSLSYGNESDAAYVLIGQQARGQLILQKVPLVNQQNYTSCGEAAFAMGWNYRHPEWGLDIGMVETIGQTLGIYFPARSSKPRGYLGTPPSGMEVIGDYYAAMYNLLPPTVGNIDLDNGGAYARLEAKGLLYSQLSAGNPVIIEVTDIIGTPSKIYNDSHYVIVTGMNFDTGIVTYNDPLINLSMSGKYSGYNRSAEWTQIWASWFNNKDINPGEGGHPGRGWYMIVH